MEEASILEPPRITAKTQAELEAKLESHLLHRSRGSHWIGEMKDDAYSVDVHYAYYIQEPDRTRCVHDYPRLVTVPVRKRGSQWETKLPSMAQIRDRYHEAGQLYDRATLEASSEAFSPLVAVVGRTAGHLAKFEGIYVNRFQRGKRLFPSRDLKPEYIVYLETQGIIEGDSEHGYVPTKETQNHIKRFRERFPQVEPVHATDASPVLFLSLCLCDWPWRRASPDDHHVLRLLTSIFDHHFRAKADPEHPEAHPLSLDGIKARMVRLGWGKPSDDDLRPRLQHLRDAKAIDYSDDYIVHMRPEPTAARRSPWINIAAASWTRRELSWASTPATCTTSLQRPRQFSCTRPSRLNPHPPSYAARGITPPNRKEEVRPEPPGSQPAQVSGSGE